MRAQRAVRNWTSIDRQNRRFGVESIDATWRARLLDGFPAGWKSLLIREHEKRLPRDPMESPGDVIDLQGQVIAQGPNSWLREVVARLRSAQRAGVEPGDSDGEICRKAQREQRLMRAWFDAWALRVRRARADAVRPAGWVERLIIRVQCIAAKADLARRDLLDMWPKGRGLTRAGKLARLQCDRWWRRTLRKAHAFMVEAESIALGLVRKGLGLYVSDDSLKRRTGQRARNAASLQSMAVVSETESTTLAEVAARGVANSYIRRSELMTRIAGFEVIANELGHPAQFVTVTCPSRMHKWRRGEGQSVENPNYDGTLPGDANRYLAKQWGRMRAAAKRAGLGLYGFRIAEPHHDGCPHWHLLLWHPNRTDKQANGGATLGGLLDRYFRQNDSADEPGAARYRIKVERVDASKGSAVAYVAKYVAKNIDGYAVGNDLYGLPALESSQRVEAWASTWRIRQFQQIGGAPVTVWRELRRVNPFLPTIDAVDSAFEGLGAANLSALSQMQGDKLTSEVDEAHRIKQGWAAYIRLQGGPTAKRKAHVLRMWQEKTGAFNRYGEISGPVPVGVLAFGQELARVGAVQFTRPRVDRLESERSIWQIVPLRGVQTVQAVHASVNADEVAAARKRASAVLDWWDEHGSNLERGGEPAAPWTRVNNCTQGTGGGLVAADVTHKKTGQRFNWHQRRPSTLIEKPNGGVQTIKDLHHEQPRQPGNGQRHDIDAFAS